MAYQLTWITKQLAVGYAPMSYAELDSIREQGIGAIVNLCGEFCDLHEIEEQSGFEVYYLPIPDECAPDMEEMEKALEWLDEAFYLGKKVLVHCRHGHGRTGTFVSAYLLRRGHGLKLAEKTLKMKKTGATPTNYEQWKLLRKYGKKEGRLTIREPSLELRGTVDLGPYFEEYQGLIQEIDNKLNQLDNIPACGRETHDCCREYFEIHLVESIYLTHTMNRILKSSDRTEAIERAVKTATAIRRLRKEQPVLNRDEFCKAYQEMKHLCPLSVDAKCIMFHNRPLRCRCFRIPEGVVDIAQTETMLSNLSRNIYFSLAGDFPPADDLFFSLADTVSGRFVQAYFQYMMEYSSR